MINLDDLPSNHRKVRAPHIPLRNSGYLSTHWLAKQGIEVTIGTAVLVTSNGLPVGIFLVTATTDPYVLGLEEVTNHIPTVTIDCTPNH